MIVLRHRIEKYPDLPVHTSSDSLRTLESGFKNVRIRLIAVEFARMRVDGSRIRKGKNIRTRVDGLYNYHDSPQKHSIEEIGH